MKEKNNEITPMNWLLSILGIILLSCFIILPPVFRAVFKETKPIVEPDQPVIEHMTCTKSNYVVDTHYENDSITFNYLNNRINTYKKEMTMTFNTLEEFNAEKEMLGRLVTGYSFIQGASYIVTPNDGDLKINITQEYNLGTFKKTSVTIPGDLEPTQLTSDYTRDDSVSDIRVDLVNSGYTCR